MKKILFLSLSMVLATASLAQEQPSKEQIKTWALEAILEKPEIIAQAVRLLEHKEQQEQAQRQQEWIADNFAAVSADPNAPIMGNPDGDVTVVEFFDYNCGYCRRAFKDLQALVVKDSNVKVLFREFPILSEGSLIAARAALAAAKQNKYVAFHTAMMEASKTIDETVVMDVAAQIGLDVAQLRKDMHSSDVNDHISTSRELARALNFNGTPAFVVGKNAIGGMVPLNRLVTLVQSARTQEQ